MDRPKPTLTALASAYPALLLQAVLIVAAGFAVYAPALNGAWLWDDPQYVTANPLLSDPAGLGKAWFAPGSTMEFYPLQESVIALQWRLWGPHPLGYHLINIALHIASGFLLWRLFAWLGGLLFVVHPLNVESVAWISELKNTLSLPPLLLALLAMVRHVERPRRVDYLLALGFFTAAMLAKISMAPFPFVILLYIWWKRGRLAKDDFVMAAPFLVIAVTLAVLTVGSYVRYGQLHPDHPLVPMVGGLDARIALAGLTVLFYFTRFFWPWEPMPMYPQWVVDPPAWYEFLPWLGWIALLAWFWKERQVWGRHALLGVGFFLVMIAPFCGLVTQSYMYFAWVMDHFMYIPMIGLMGISLAGLEAIETRLTGGMRVAGMVTLGMVIFFLSWQSRVYTTAWTDGGTLWSYAVAANPGAWLAHYNLGNNARRDARWDDAIAEYQIAVRLHPTFDWSHNNLGLSLLVFPDRQPEAMTEFREAIRLRPDFPEAHTNLANILAQRGDLTGAMPEYRAALASKPDFAEARYDLALALANTGHPQEAKGELKELLRRKPEFAPAEELLERLKGR